MVGIGPGGTDSALARVSLVNSFGQVLLDAFVKPKMDVTDFRTFVSGIRPQDLVHAEPLESVQKRVADIISDRILVGHAVENDLKAMLLSHPRAMIRDTSRYKPFRKLVGFRSPGLRFLAAKFLNLNIQSGEHSSVRLSQQLRTRLVLMRLNIGGRCSGHHGHLQDARKGMGPKAAGAGKLGAEARSVQQDKRCGHACSDQ